MAPIKVVFGAAAFPHGAFEQTPAQEEALESLLRAGVTTLDTARLYPGSEEAIGKLPKRTSFAIDTKLPGGFTAGRASKQDSFDDIQDSISRLQVPQVDILYLHSPEPDADVKDTLAGVNEAYKKGWFKRFGLSNFTPEQVQNVYDISEKEGWVLPSVYQANYNPVARHLETELFPLLRKLNISIYAYSPIAGGFLTKTTEDLDAGAGRFNKEVIGGLYLNLYGKPTLRAALAEWGTIAEEEGVSKAELAYRWVGYHSALKAELGDAVIFGASKLKYIEETPAWLRKGGLSEGAVKRIEGIWESVKAEAPTDNYGANKAA